MEKYRPESQNDTVPSKLNANISEEVPVRADGRPYRSMEAVHTLIDNVREGDEASFDRLVALYEPTVNRLISQYIDKAQFPEDLRQEGLAAVMGVIRRTIDFHSEMPDDIIENDKYLTMRITDAVKRALEQYSERDPDIKGEHFEKIKVKIEEQKRAKEEYDKLLKSLGPSGYGGADPETRRKLSELYSKAQHNYPEYARSEINAVESGTYKNIGKPPLSTDDPEVIDTPAENDTVEEALREVLKSDIDKVLSKLREREIRVLEFRFGLHGESEHTLVETARILGVTKERIRQIEVKALQKIRYHGFEELKEYL